MKILCCGISIFIILMFAKVNAQTPGVHWGKYYPSGKLYYQTPGEGANSSVQTRNGGYITVGYSSFNSQSAYNRLDNHGGGDILVMKYDNAGDTVWHKCYGGSGGEAGQYIEAVNGGYILVGHTSSNNSGQVGVTNGGLDYWIVKINDTGAIVWQKTYGGSLYDSAAVIHQTYDGGYIVGGSTKSNDYDVSGNHGDYDYWIVKLDSAGSVQWKKTLGGSDKDLLTSLVQTNDSGFAAVGYTASVNGDVTGNHGNLDYWVVKIDKNGNLVWQKTLGGTLYDIPGSILQKKDGTLIVTGQTNSNDGDVSGNHGDYDFWIVRLSSSGSILSQKPIGGLYADNGYAGTLMSDNGYVLIGVAMSNNGDFAGTPYSVGRTIIVKLDSSYNVVWKRRIDIWNNAQYDVGSSVIETSDNQVAVAGKVRFAYTNDYFFTFKTGDTAVFVTQPTINSVCQGGTFNLPFKVYNSFRSGNIFNAELSNASGSFASPVIIGSKTAIGSDTITCTIPPGTMEGYGYRVRITASAPSYISPDNGENISIFKVVTPSVYISVIPGTYISIGTTVTFSANVFNGNSNDHFRWSLNGNYIPGATNNTYITNTLQEGDVVGVEVYGDNQCYTPTSNKADTIHINTGVTSVLKDQMGFLIYPNPATDKINVSANKTVLQVEVYDMKGVFLTNGTNEADVEILSIGMYVVKALDVSGRRYIGKFIKQ